MIWVDWTIIAIIGVSSLISLKRGFVREAMSLASWVIAFFVAVAFHERLAALFNSQIESISLRQLIAFAILFVVTLLVCGLINMLVAELVKATGLSGTDRLLGMVFGMARGAVVVLAIVILVPMILPVNQESWWHESQIIPHLLLLEDWSRQTFSQLVNWAQELFSAAKQAG